MSEPYKHKSGRIKRKEREKRDADSKKGQTTLADFLKRPRQDETETEKESDDVPGQLEQESCDEIESDHDATEIDADQEEEQVNTPESPDRSEIDLTHHDLGNFLTGIIADKDIERLVQIGPKKNPEPGEIENDLAGKPFPYSLFSKKLANGETVKRDYLYYSQKQKALYCFPCRLFHYKSFSLSVASNLALPSGSNREMGYFRLYKAIPAHENSKSHRQCYLHWKNQERALKSSKSVNSMLEKDMNDQIQKWREILRRVQDVLKFLGKRGLPLRGHSEKIGDPHNGNFLGIIELLSTYDPVLQDHVRKISDSQKAGKRLQAHYLSNRIQDEFIQICGRRIRESILLELKSSRYYSFMVDGTPDVSCQEQATFVFRYVLLEDGAYQIKERFYTFVDDNGKTGTEIAELILKVLADNDVPLSLCRGQGYDNAANMSGEHTIAYVI